MDANENLDKLVKSLQDLFCNETGYQTPKLDTRGCLMLILMDYIILTNLY